MDIHKPKPWHGVRDFLKEYAIIVVGVLTALGGEQAVEWSHRQREVREAREALRAEIERDLTVIQGNVRQDTCMRRFLPRLEGWAQNGGPRPSGTAFIYNGLASTAWDVAKTGAVAQMPLADRLAYANFYDEVALYQTLVERERTINTQIGGLYRMATTLSPQDAHDLRLAANAYDGLLRIKIGQARPFERLGGALGAKALPQPPRAEAYLAAVCAAADGVTPPPGA